MKRFDLRQIMRDAHRTYKYVGKKQGKTFGEVLKSTWKLATKDNHYQRKRNGHSRKHIETEHTANDGFFE